MCCAGRRHSAGFRRWRWSVPTKYCCTSAVPGRWLAAPTRAWPPALMKASPAALSSHAASTRLARSGSLRTCCQTGGTAWRCGPMVQVSAVGAPTIHASTSAAGAMTCCVMRMAVLFICGLAMRLLPIRSLRIRLLMHSGSTTPASWQTGCSLMPHQQRCRSPPLCWSARRTTPSCARCRSPIC